jgi:hypothetical protein
MRDFQPYQKCTGHGTDRRQRLLMPCVNEAHSVV